MIVSASIECLIYDARSLKEKRAVLQRIMNRLAQTFNIAVAEVDHQDVWQRTTIAIVTVNSSNVTAEKESKEPYNLLTLFPKSNGLLLI
ncbi:hypothetical protein SAMN05877753_107208 [Bacillus oleivorans]|uniref:DUF503 domain-containing protein n=1 Tax=Bacillus oleivorans TaxID=1448271 RepID=A0A285D3M2_9BACI|nr:hypothetical protein SAMN05877753_107208 [Bacillus oleivorans]